MARIARLTFAASLLGAFLPMSAWAQQTVVLRDGSHFIGRMTGITDHDISFRDLDGNVHTIDIARVDVIRFDHSDGRAGDYAPSNRSNLDASPPMPSGGPIQQRNWITLPTGTAISVRTNQVINTEDSNPNQTYSAQVSKEVVDGNGNPAIARGSEVKLIVRHLSDGILALDLQSVFVNGKRYTVDTGDLIQGTTKEGVGASKRTAEYGGSGAVLGTLLGAIAGGGRGAAIGALAGAAVGVGTEVLTRGPVIRVPAESVLNFRLDNPMSLRPSI